MLKRILTSTLLAVAAVLLIGAPSASAAPLCATPPDPLAPKTGFSGLLTRPPAAPATGDPFTDPQVAIHDVYGTSWNFIMYDLGCIPDTTGGDVIARFDNGNAKLVMGAAATNVAVLGLLEGLAKESSIGWLSEWIGSMSEAIRPIVFGGPGTGGGLLPLALLVTAVWMAWVSKSGKLSRAGHQLAVLAVSFVLATWALAAPAYFSRTADTAVTTAAKAGGAAFNASLTDGVNRQAMYRAWLTAHFGDADSDTAKQFGPRLAEATHYTWAEWAQPAEQRETVKKAKQDRFKEVADEIKRADPDAYAHLTGAAGSSRSGPAFYAATVAGVMSLFAVLAMIIIIVSRIMMQALVIVAPIGAILGVLPRGERSLRDMAGLFLASLWNAFKFSLAAGLMAVLMGQLMTVDPVSAVVWMLAATVVFFVVLKPFRSFKTMVPGLDPGRSYTKEVFRFVTKTAVGAAAGGVAGGVAGAAQATNTTEKTTENTTTVVESRTPPAPVFQQLPDARVPHATMAPTPDRPMVTAAPPPPGRGLPGPAPAPAPPLPSAPAGPAALPPPPTPPAPHPAPAAALPAAPPAAPAAPAALPAAPQHPTPQPAAALPAAPTQPATPAPAPHTAPPAAEQPAARHTVTVTVEPRATAEPVVLEGTLIAGPDVYVPSRQARIEPATPARQVEVYRPSERTTA